MVPLRAGFGTLPEQVAGRSQGQNPTATLHGAKSIMGIFRCQEF